jgi:hypothetical protein
MAWTDGVTRATNDVVTASDWNTYLGATGSLMELEAGAARVAFRANRHLVAQWAAQGVGAAAAAYGIGFNASGNSTPALAALSGEGYLQLSAGGAETGWALASRDSGGGLVAVNAPSKSLRMLMRVLLPAASANLTRWIAGFVSADSLTANGAYLRIATTGNVFFVTRQTTETVTDLGALSRVAMLGFEIETADAGVTWVCRNQAGTQLASHTGDVPTAATALIHGNFGVTAAALPFGLAYLQVEGTFS